MLDRANVIEFRVTTDDLVDDMKKPVRCEKAAPGYASSFLRVARAPVAVSDTEADKPFRERLREIHRLLSDDGFEFGHRVYHEATRFAALHATAGGGGVIEALDLQVMQKILPRLHGSRRQIEGLLLKLGRYCHHLDAEKAGSTDDPTGWEREQAKLPRSFEKLCRMLKRLRANQFVSFTE